MPVVKSCGVHFHPAGTVIPESWFAAIHDFDLWVTISGKAIAHLPCRSTYTLTRGSCLWISPGDIYRFEVVEAMSHIWIHFDLVNEDHDLIDYASLKAPDRFAELPNLHLVEQVARRVVLLKRHYRDNSHPRAGLAREIGAHFLKGLLLEFQLAQTLPKPPGAPSVSRHHLEVISDALSWIYFEPETALSPSVVARKYGYSLKHFSKLFRQTCGGTLSQMIIESRIERARALLSNSSLNIAQIADRLGYEDAFYFSRQFKKITGESPQHFRSTHSAGPDLRSASVRTSNIQGEGTLP